MFSDERQGKDSTSNQRAMRANDQGRYGSLRNSLAGALSPDGDTVNAVHHSEYQRQEFKPEVDGKALSGQARTKANLPD